MTSLEQQLKRLKTPQTDEFRQQKYRPSFLYDRVQAASIDCETHHRIAKKGLKKLTKLNSELENYKDLLSQEYRELERATLHQDKNDELSVRLRKFIHSCVVPFFMLNECHEVLEYLIYKYKIHSYQTNDLLCAILPYHETRLFARLLQTIDSLDNPYWNWLEPYKSGGIPVPKDRIIHTLSNRTRLPLVSLLGDKLVEINSDTTRGGVYNSFYTVTMMCVLDRDMDEKFYLSFVPLVYRAIKKTKNSSLFLSGLVLIGYLAYTQDLEFSFMKRMSDRLTKTYEKLIEKPDIDKDLIEKYYKRVIDLIDEQMKVQSPTRVKKNKVR